MTKSEEKENDFRDSLATADDRGQRIWIFPTKPKGSIHRARAWTALFLLAFLFSAPFIKVGGHPLLQFDIIHRHFFIFGLTFWPQDFHLFVLFTITLVVLVCLFTTVYGRLFCGWLCPQTVFLEMVFRKIEYFIEGTAGQQRALAKQKMNGTKFFKKSIKHIIFYALSFLIGNIFLAYIVGVDELYKIITDPPHLHTTGLSFMLLFSGLFYFVFAWFREQACTLVCPYARLQSVLLDNNSVVVAYDHKRGEPRGPKALPGEEETNGDCIDCNACVRVCPTGIDIRNSTQLECVNCAVCIDACNDVMRKVERPTGLIRYSSLNNIEKGTKFRFTSRIIGYTIVLVFLIGLLTTLLLARTEIEATIMRAQGQLFVETDDGILKNLYNLKLVNKSQKEIVVEMKIKGREGNISLIGLQQIIVPVNGLAEAVFFVELDKSTIYSPNTLIEIEISSEGKEIETIKTSFMGPRSTK